MTQDMVAMDELIEAIRHRLLTKATDLGALSHPTLKPTNHSEVAEEERRLGFQIPPLMKRLYTEVGNGGFGPGYGLIGLRNGIPDDLGKTALEIYQQFRVAGSEEPNWKWPEGLLPICHWGCAIVSCVDCADPNFRMRIFDPNVHEGEDWSDSFFEEYPRFDAWITAWASGVNLWALMYGEEGQIASLLSARHPLR
jgi:hypothetical protein